MATLTVSEKAKEKLLDSMDGEGLDPTETLVRVGARPGGCSGYTFTIETTDHKENGEDEYDYGDLRMCVNRWDLHNLIGTVQVDFRDDNIVEQGFVFKRAITGGVCGCGESFTPLDKIIKGKEDLGWK